MTTPTPIARVRLCGSNTFHNSETPAVVPDREAAIRDIPGVITVDQAKALVDRGEAMWLDPLPDLERRRQTERVTT